MSVFGALLMAEEGGTTSRQPSVVANRLLIIGDSLTMGAAEVSGNDVARFITPAYPTLLRDRFPHLDIVETSGVRHDTNTTRKQLPILLETHKPAVVLVAVGGSDVDLDWRKAILSNGKRTRSRVSLEDYEKNIRFIIDQIKAAGATPILIEGTSSNIAMREVYFTRLSGIDVSTMMAAGGGQATNDGRVDSYRLIVRRIAAEKQLELVPSPDGLATEDPQIIFTEDGVHLSVVAHRLLAAAYGDAVHRAFELRIAPV